jgi:hypothetical protein
MMRRSTRRATLAVRLHIGGYLRRESMWWGIGLGGILYFVLLFTLGLMTLKKGHWVMFILGIFLPLFWLIGALIPPTRAAEQPV